MSSRMFRSRDAAIALATCLTLFAAGSTSAQESRGSITGQLLDSSGGAVPGATVVALHADTNLPVQAVSDGAGTYRLLYLPAGRYTVSAELQGFKKVVRSGVEVRVGDKLTLDLTLEPGSLTESVEVTSSTPLLDSSSGSNGQVIDSRRINLLPLSDGNPFALARLAPGAAYTGDLKFSRPFDNGGTSGISANGGTTMNEFTLDGSPNLAHGRRVAYVPPSDAVAEFKVETATFDAQQGHTGGANVNVVMKSGTNKLHGTAYGFYRSDKISANDFFLNKGSRPRAKLSYNRYGGSLGGPVALPGYNGSDRTFFFAAYEGLQDEFAEPLTFTVPTEAQRRGDFSALLGQNILIYDPLSAFRNAEGRIQRTAFPGNIIPASRLNPVALNYLKLYPAPNQEGDAQGRNNFLSPNPRTDDFNSASLRIDHRVSSKNRFFARYSWNDRVEKRGNWTGEVDGIRPTGNQLFRTNHNFTFDHVYNHSAETLFNVRVGFSRFEEPNIRQHENVFDPKSLGFSGNTAALFGDAQYVPRFDFPDLSYSALGGYTIPDNLPSLQPGLGDQRFTNVWSVQPTLTRLMGDHSVRIGYDFRLHRDNRLNPGNAAGLYTFTNEFTKADSAASATVGAGQQLAALLLGMPSSGSIDRNASRANQNLYHGLFIQDDWKVSKRLTVNLGLRYDYETAATERYNRSVRGFDPNAASPIASQAQAAYSANPVTDIAPSAFRVQGGLTYVSAEDRGAWKADKNNLQPRLGFAYLLNEKTILRGGGGIYTVPNLLETFNQSNFSLSTNLVPTGDGGLTFASPQPLSNPFPNGVSEPTGSALGAGTFMGRALGDTDQHVFLMGETRENEMAARWSIGIQRELPGQWVVEASYVGNRGYNLTVNTVDGTNVRNYVEINAVPERYLSTSPVRNAAAIDNLTGNVANPFAGLLPGTAMNGSQVQRQQLLKPYPQFLNVRTERRDGTSTYNAAQFRLEKRFTSNYSLLVGYTYSKFTEKTYLLNPTDTTLSRYLADGDMPHRVTISAIWLTPIGKDRALDLGAAGNAILGGWSVQGIYNWQSGRPVTFPNVYYDGDPSQLSADYSDPDRTFDTSGFYFHDAAVQTGGVDDPAKQRTDPRTLLANNVRYFPLRPGLRNQAVSLLDASLVKTITFRNDVRLQLRFEAINALNQAVFGNPNTTPSSANFAKSTGQNNIPRNLQLGVKLLF
jgi:hypothetical protein